MVVHVLEVARRTSEGVDLNIKRLAALRSYCGPCRDADDHVAIPALGHADQQLPGRLEGDRYDGDGRSVRGENFETVHQRQVYVRSDRPVVRGEVVGVGEREAARLGRLLPDGDAEVADYRVERYGDVHRRGEVLIPEENGEHEPVGGPRHERVGGDVQSSVRRVDVVEQESGQSGVCNG